jgi:hypothetical protein
MFVLRLRLAFIRQAINPVGPFLPLRRLYRLGFSSHPCISSDFCGFVVVLVLTATCACYRTPPSRKDDVAYTSRIHPLHLDLDRPPWPLQPPPPPPPPNSTTPTPLIHPHHNTLLHVRMSPTTQPPWDVAALDVSGPLHDTWAALLAWGSLAKSSFVDFVCDPRVATVIIAWAVTYTIVMTAAVSIGFGSVGVIKGSFVVHTFRVHVR